MCLVNENNGYHAGEHSPIDQFIKEFQNWLTAEFLPMLSSRMWDTPDPSEPTVILIPWVNRLRHLGEIGALYSISPGQAIDLKFWLNRALDDLGDEYRRWRASQSIMILALSPIDDILAYLSLVSERSGLVEAVQANANRDRYVHLR